MLIFERSGRTHRALWEGTRSSIDGEERVWCSPYNARAAVEEFLGDTLEARVEEGGCCDRVLEEAIAANRDDPRAIAAYADWLDEHGDPRAAFLRGNEVTPADARRLAGPIVEDPEVELHFKHGFIDAAQLEYNWQSYDGEPEEHPRASAPELTAIHALRWLAAMPSARLLRQLSIGYVDGAGLAIALLAHACPIGLESLRLPQNAYDPSPLATLPRLRELRVSYTAGPTLARGTWRALERLTVLGFDRWHYNSPDARPVPEDFTSFFVAAPFPALERLSIPSPGCGVTDALVALAESTLAPQLKELSLRATHPQLTLDQVRTIAAVRPRFARLERLELSSHIIANPVREKLREIPNLVLYHWNDELDSG